MYLVGYNHDKDEPKMDVKAYLDWVNYPGTPSVSAESLSGLHQAHAFTIPFENLDVMNGVPIRLDQERFYKKIVGTKRGGLCYEMNGLFKGVLDSIGFESWFIACQVYFPPADTLGPGLGHVAIVTRLDEALYLVDVGFGRGFIQPLKLDFTGPQFQLGTWYRLSPLPGEEVLLERSADGQEYQKMYKFTLVCRALSDFEEACRYHQTSPQAPFTRQPLCSRPTSEGRITLTGSSLVITNHGEKQEEPISSEAEFEEKLAQYFGIRQDKGRW
jgi:N-hydroxyarylamine O-acetyltransferase